MNKSTKTMRVSKISFRGYQRLADTSCNTDGKMIAFLGPNEAGKTTVLKALDWFSNGEGELPLRNRNRRNPPTNASGVVEVVYWLEKDDIAALADVGLLEQPKTYRRTRQVDGTFNGNLTPPGRRNPAPIEAARAAMVAAHALEDPVDPDDDDESQPRLANWSATIDEALSDVDGNWEDEWDEDFSHALEYLDGRGNEPAAEALRLARRLLQVNPDEEARRILRARAPKFVLFTEEDRDMRSAYNLADPDLRDDPPKALANLAWVAGLDLDDLWRAVENGVVRDARTIERKANTQLSERLGSRWSQKALDVQFNVDGSNLEILIYEHAEDGADTPIEERSDGLRTFVALVAFLARHDFDVPPVLLVDEAETHLHYDAQADLVEVLTRDVDATQVFYTTHSPGCLPRDLGTGIRLVSPLKDKSDESVLRNDFWTSNSPGFTPLLFAMGAGAAAFSAFRKALLTEGAGDMILLPSLFRMATNKSDLDFQVAPGIANYHGSGLELEEVAARVLYLVDGDAGGDDHKARLLDMGIPETRIKQLPKPKAAEDYVHPDVYLAMVNAFLQLGGASDAIAPEDLNTDVSIGKAVELWCDARNLRVPGKTIVATQLVSSPNDLRLADGAKEELTALHAEIVKGLNAKPTKGATS